MSSVSEFNSFVVGIASWLKDESDSALFRWGCHRLAFAMTQNYPLTQIGLRSLLEKPLQDWYPYDIPDKFNAAAGFIDKGQLSAAAERYFQELQVDDLPDGIPEKYLELDNKLFAELFNALREAHKKGDTTAQKEYVLLRRFLIENPYTTPKQIRKTFLCCKYATVPKVGNLYKRLSAQELESPLWVCDRCGPLMLKGHQLRGKKASICNDHRKSMDIVHKVEPQKNMLRLRRGLQLQVLIPGIPEIETFDLLEALRDSSTAELSKVCLYPEIDRYDLQLRFIDGEVWAVDVKDYPDPSDLSMTLELLSSSGSLRYDQGLYVVPQVYIKRNKDYLMIAQSNADMKGMQLMGTDSFEAKVKAKIKQLKREAKK